MKTMDGFKLKNYITAVDLIVISYLFDTLILSFFIREPHGWVHPVLFRLLSFFTIGLIIYHDKKYPSRTSHFIHFFYPVLLLSYIYGETATLNHIFFAQPLDNLLVAAENALFQAQPALTFSKVYDNNGIAELMSFSYFSYYFFVAGLPLAAFFRKEKKEEQEKILFMIVGAFLFYYAFFIIFPTWGPQYYLLKGPHEIGEGIFPALVSMAQRLGEAPTGAFPSSHVGMMLVFCWLSAKYFKKILWITIAMTVLISFSTVYIQAHYIVDVIGAYISAPAVIYLAEGYYKLSQKIME